MRSPWFEECGTKTNEETYVIMKNRSIVLILPEVLCPARRISLDLSRQIWEDPRRLCEPRKKGTHQRRGKLKCILKCCILKKSQGIISVKFDKRESGESHQGDTRASGQYRRMFNPLSPNWTYASS